MTSAGNMRDRVTVQRQTAATDDYGNARSAPWVPILTVWADMMERPGAERIASGAIEASRMATVRVRRSDAAAAVTAADRLVARGQVWNIRSIAAIGKDRALIEWTVETGVAT